MTHNIYAHSIMLWMCKTFVLLLWEMRLGAGEGENKGERERGRNRQKKRDGKGENISFSPCCLIDTMLTQQI